MSNKSIKDQKRRCSVAKFESKRCLYKALSQDMNLSLELRTLAALKLSKLPRNSSSTRIRNRCIITGRPRSTYKIFRLSRIVFRELASKGALAGINKASW